MGEGKRKERKADGAGGAGGVLVLNGECVLSTNVRQWGGSSDKSQRWGNRYGVQGGWGRPERQGHHRPLVPRTRRERERREGGNKLRKKAPPNEVRPEWRKECKHTGYSHRISQLIG